MSNFRGPLAKSYPASVALVVFALIPYLALTSAINPLDPILQRSLPLSKQALELASGMANAGYAFGTVLAVQFAQHLRGRRMLIIYASLFVIGSIVTALAPTPGLFIAGHVLQGLTTSLMLIAAVPPLVIGWPVSKMPWTAFTMNLCIFGAVAIGPVIGGVQAGQEAWRPLFWIVAAFGVLALLFSFLTFEDVEPQDTEAPWDFLALILGGGGAAAAFFGASELVTHKLLSLIVFLPLVGGLAAVIVLVVHQYHVKNPLMPVRQMVSTLPVVGVTMAMCAGAAAIGLISIVETAAMKTMSPTHLAMLFWPEFGAAVATAILFGGVFRTRFMPVLPITGMAVLAGGAAVVTGVASDPNVLIPVGAGLIGFGVGASVSPGLFMAGFSLRSEQIQRVFALIELLRGIAAFLATPLILHLAMTVGGTPAVGMNTAIWVCFGIAAGGGALALYLMVIGRARLQTPDLESWQHEGQPAWDSPPVAAGLREPRRRPETATRDGRRPLVPPSFSPPA